MKVGELAEFEAIPVRSPSEFQLAVELVQAPDPWEIALRLAHLPNLFFLDSSEKHETRGRYSYVTANWGQVSHHSTQPPGKKTPNPLHRIEHLLPVKPLQLLPELPPFQGGLGILLSYELGQRFDRLPKPRWDEFRAPEWVVVAYDWVISFDHVTNRAWIISNGFGHDYSPDLYRARRQIVEVLSLIRKPRANLDQLSNESLQRQIRLEENRLSQQHPLPGFPGVTSNFDRVSYETAVQKAVDYVHAGDCFQVNLSQRLLAPLREHPLELYGRLRQLNPAPFAAYFDLGNFQILSSSPESFLRLANGVVETRPIKGTRPRSRTPTEDAAFVLDLTNNPKDLAENVMIVDLMRNDLGKVCEY